MERHRFDVGGRLLEVRRRDDSWQCLWVGEGRMRPAEGVEVPAEVSADQLRDHLEDLLHELATADRDAVIAMR